MYAPPDCVIWHLTWVLRTEAERIAKLEVYEAQQEGAGRGYATYYLPERVAEWDYRGDVADLAVVSLAHRLRGAETHFAGAGRRTNAGNLTWPSETPDGQSVTCLPFCHWNTTPVTKPGP